MIGRRLGVINFGKDLAALAVSVAVGIGRRILEYQYRKRNPAVVATLLFSMNAFAKPPLYCERMRPM
jgi:hypothetical protein